MSTALNGGEIEKLALENPAIANGFRHMRVTGESYEKALECMVLSLHTQNKQLRQDLLAYVEKHGPITQ